MFDFAFRMSSLVLFLPFGGLLSLIDWRTHRLPNRHLFACFSCLLGLQTLLSCGRGDFSKSHEAIKVAFLCLGVFVILYMVSRGQLGMGDVKYSFVLGLVVGWTNPDGWLLFIWLSFIFATLWSVWKFFRREIQFGSHLAFAPFLTVGVIASCLPIVF